MILGHIDDVQQALEVELYKVLAGHRVLRSLLISSPNAGKGPEKAFHAVY